ncbi:MAG: substrate-binding domain-containing protein [Elusimicrobiota bacterium]
MSTQQRIIFILMVISLVFPSIVFGKVKITVTARCFFGSIVMTKEKFEKKTGIEVIMNDTCAGLDEGVKSVIEGKSDIGTMARALTEKEKKAGLVEIPLSVDGIAVLVNKDNKINEISTEDVLNITAGNIRNWKEVGGNDSKILIFTQQCGASEEKILESLFKKYGINVDREYLSKVVVEADITDTLVQRVEAYKSSIALVPQMFHTEKVKFLKVDGCLPTRENVLANIIEPEKEKIIKKYPLIRPLNLVVKGKPKGEVKRFIDFMIGNEGKEIIEKNLSMDWLKEGF